MAIRGLLSSATVGPTTRQLAAVLAGLAWSLAAARLCAPQDYWQRDASRGVLLFGALFGGTNAGFQPLAIWSSLLLWWRGYALPDWEPGLDEIFGRLRLGCLAIAAVMSLPALGESGGSSQLVQVEQLVAAAAFLLTAILASGVGRRREMAGGAPSAPALSAGGTSHLKVAPIMVIAAAAAVLIFTAWGADQLSPETLAPAVALGGRVLESLSTGISSVLALLGGMWAGLTPPGGSEVPSGAEAKPTGAPAAQGGSPSQWLGIAVLIMALLGGLILIALLAIAIRHALARRDNDTLPDRTELLPQFPEQRQPEGPLVIFALLLRLFRFLKPRDVSGTVKLQKQKPRGSPGPSRDSARAAYRAFLAWAAERGWPRRPAETPEEYRHRLAEVDPESQREASLLTGLYEHARYGTSAGSPVELRQAQQALQRLAVGDRGRAPGKDQP